jgi:hypothetical protein
MYDPSARKNPDIDQYLRNCDGVVERQSVALALLRSSKKIHALKFVRVRTGAKQAQAS